jgi:hypothetical protein
MGMRGLEPHIVERCPMGTDCSSFVWQEGRSRPVGSPLPKLSAGSRHGAPARTSHKTASITGPGCGNASGDGRSKAYLSGFLRPCQKMPISNMALIDGTIVKVHRHGAGAKGGLKIR